MDASGQQQLKQMQSGSSSSAQRAVRRRITHVLPRGFYLGFGFGGEDLENDGGCGTAAVGRNL